MSLRILSKNTNSTRKLLEILQHYFPPGNSITNKCSILIQNKYYTCVVPVVCMDSQKTQILIPDQGDIQNNQQSVEQKKDNAEQVKVNSNISQKQQQIMSQQQRTDFVIFLFNIDDLLTHNDMKQFIDMTIAKYEPESYIICINSDAGQQRKWKCEEYISSCENFISVVYSNLNRMIKQKPIWSQAGLLAEQQEPQDGLFEIFQLFQTTIWTNAQKNSLKVAKVLQVSKEISVNNGEQLQTTKIEEKQEKKQKQENQKEKQIQEEHMMENQQQLQKEMEEFESLMQQMMAMKTTPIAGNERKTRAEDLIMKLTKNFDF